MKYQIYKGSLGCPEEVILEGDRIPWADALKLCGYKMNDFCRVCYFEDGKHIDFGSYTVFVKVKYEEGEKENVFKL